MATNTTNFSFTLPGVADPADQDIWGGQLNSNWTSLDALLLVSSNNVTRAESSSPVSTSTTDQNKLLLIDATSGNITVNLLAAATAKTGFSLTIKKTDSSTNTVIIDGNSSETIDGAATLTLPKEDDSVTLTTNGSNWFINADARELPDSGVAAASYTNADITVDAEGIITAAANGVAGKVLQIVQTPKTNTFSTTSTSAVDITGMAATITPSATSSKILILSQISTGSVDHSTINILRGSTQILRGDAASSRPRSTVSAANQVNNIGDTQVIIYLDSPSTTSATTYKLQATAHSGSFTLNKNPSDTDGISGARTTSTILLVEIGA